MDADWFEWANLWLSIPLAFIGFAITLGQVVSAKRAASGAQTSAQAAETAAKQAGKEAREQYRALSALSLMHQLQGVEEAFEFAASQKSVDLLRKFTINWIYQANMCRTFLDKNNPNEAALEIKIQSSVSAVKTLKQKIAKVDANTDWQVLTTRPRKTIGDVTADLGSLTALQAVRELP